MNRLKELWEKFKEWLAVRTQREQILVIGCAAIFGILLIYEILIVSFNAWLQDKQQNVIEHQLILANMQQLEQQIKDFPRGFIALQTVTLLSLQTLMSQAGLTKATSNIQQLNNKQFLLQVNNIQFETLMQFLINVARQYKLQVTQLTLQNDRVIGAVKGKVVLQ